MTDLDRLLQQSRQITERIRILADEHRTLRVRYQLESERSDTTDSSSAEPSTETPTIQDAKMQFVAG